MIASTSLGVHHISSQLSIALVTLIIAYLIVEVAFFFHYHYHILPAANRIRSSLPPAPYRDYRNIEDRAKLLHRILDRLRNRLPATHQSVNDEKEASAKLVYSFIESWFIKKSQDDMYEKFSHQFDEATFDVGFCPPPPLMIRMAWSSAGSSVSIRDGSKNESSSESLETLELEANKLDMHQNASKKLSPSAENLGKLQKENMNEFLSWAFFGIHYSIVQSTPEMNEVLEQFYVILKNQAGLTFEEGKNTNFVPRCFTFEKVNSLYRPYGIYASVQLMRFSANCVLYALGFRRYSCERGLIYWHRPATKQRSHFSNGKRPVQNQLSPFLFFHGIAPGGHAPYLPMIFLGMLRSHLQQRDIFFFENKPVSYALCMDALSECDTVHGVIEAVNQHLDEASANRLTVCGHSFGSCQLTWIVQSPQLRDRLESLILLDPVSILLSEPDVMINFLYTRTDSTEETCVCSNTLLGKIIRFLNETKIHLVASSELFIEHYLRRNFAWYNSELWLDDIPPHVKVLVCLADQDEIVNCKKIEREILQHNRRVAEASKHGSLPDGPPIKLLLWKDVGHAHCVSNPEKWREIRKAIDGLDCYCSKNVRVQ